MMATVVLSFLYFALDIIALPFPVIIVSNSTYVAPAGRESEFPRTRVATWEIAPTDDAISDSAEYTWRSTTFHSHHMPNLIAGWSRTLYGWN